MKHIIFIICMLLGCNIALGQSTIKKVDSKTFQSVKVEKSKDSTYTPTGYYYVDKKGVKYEIYVHKLTRGANAGVTCCYIKKVSAKTGKVYWQKIDVKPEELK